MSDDDTFDGFGALTREDCAASLDLRWRRARAIFGCLECGTSGTLVA